MDIKKILIPIFLIYSIVSPSESKKNYIFGGFEYSYIPFSKDVQSDPHCIGMNLGFQRYLYSDWYLFTNVSNAFTEKYNRINTGEFSGKVLAESISLWSYGLGISKTFYNIQRLYFDFYINGYFNTFQISTPQEPDVLFTSKSDYSSRYKFFSGEPGIIVKFEINHFGISMKSGLNLGPDIYLKHNDTLGIYRQTIKVNTIGIRTALRFGWIF